MLIWPNFEESDLYWSRCIIERVVDGDTVIVTFNLPFNQSLRKERCRLAFIDAPEIWHSNEPGGVEATDWLRDILAQHDNNVICKTLKSEDKFGRWLIELFVPDFDHSINDEMIIRGLAKRYAK